jgi:hypothetical protein
MHESKSSSIISGSMTFTILQSSTFQSRVQGEKTEMMVEIVLG